MKKTTLAVLTALALAACSQGTPNTNNNNASGAATSGTTPAAASGAAAAPKGLETDVKQISYVFGYEMGGQLAEIKKNGGEVDVKVLAEAIQDQLDGKPSKLTPEQSDQAVKKFMEDMKNNVEKKAKEAKEAGEKFLTENKAKEGVKVTESGLQYKVVKEGTGDSPVLGDGVMVEYTGKLIDGTEFDSTKAHGGQPFAVPLTGDSVIKGWTEGLQFMKEGGEYTLYIPANLAYGENSPTPKIPANSVLVFDMKVVKIEKGAAKEGLPAKAKENKANAETKKK